MVRATPGSESDLEPPGQFQAFIAAALSVAGAVTGLSAILLALSTLLPDGAIKSAATNVLAAILAIGLLQILSEAWLKRKLSADILREVRRGETKIIRSIEDRFALLQEHPRCRGLPKPPRRPDERSRTRSAARQLRPHFRQHPPEAVRDLACVHGVVSEPGFA